MPAAFHTSPRRYAAFHHAFDKLLRYLPYAAIAHHAIDYATPPAPDTLRRV